MRLPRAGVVVAVAALIIPIAQGAIGADSVEDAVDERNRAEAAVSDASRDRARLQGTIENLAASRSALQDRLLSTLTQYQQRNAELEEVSYRVTNLRNRVITTEREVSDLRAAVQERAVTVYMRGGFNSNAVIWSASSFQEAAVLVQAVEQTFARDVEVLGNLAVTRGVLTGLREEWDGERLRLLTIRDELGTLAESLDRNFTETDSSLAQAYRDLTNADSRYRTALTDLQQAERKLATFKGAGQWRPIVERYFRPTLVEDALWVMQCESRGNPDATNPVTNAAGLYQFLPGTWTWASAGAGFAGSSRYDPEANIAAAAWLAHRSADRGSTPWGAWSCRP